MRKIEQQMNDAISNNQNWQSANTSVQLLDNGDSAVYLHGNHIATVGETTIQIFDGGYQSNTTKSRLSAILQTHGIAGEKVFQKAGEWFIRYYKGIVGEEGFVTVPFVSGMTLV